MKPSVSDWVREPRGKLNSGSIKPDGSYKDFKIGVMLKIAREESGLTQEQLAHVLAAGLRTRCAFFLCIGPKGI